MNWTTDPAARAEAGKALDHPRHHELEPATHQRPPAGLGSAIDFGRSDPSWVEEHIRHLTAAGIQSEFQCYDINSFETIERMIRRGVDKVPLVIDWVAISGGMD